MDFARHFRDLLIALEASREGATLVTENMGDFERRKTLLVSARKTLKLFNPHSVDCLTAIKFARVEQNLVRGRPCLCHSCRKLATHLDDLK